MLEHGGDIKGFQEEYGTRPLDFSANIAPCGVPEKVREAVCAAVDDAINYPDPLCRSLVRALAAHEQVSEHAVLCGNGSSDLLFRLVLALKPKRALLCAPTFAEYEQALATVGATLDFYTFSARNGFTLGADFLEHITPATNLVVLCQPNNPTGVILPPELLHAILQKCEEVGATLLIDECFVGFLDEAPGISVVSWVKEHPCLVVLKAFTKLYGIPGIRLGYALCSNGKLLEAMRAAGQPWSVSNVAQAAGVAALECIEYVEEVRSITHTQRAFLKCELADRGITTWGEANFLLFYIPEQPGAPTFVQQMREHGVLVRDCSNYRTLEQGWYRIAVRTHEENERLLQAMDAVLHARASQGAPQNNAQALPHNNLEKGADKTPATPERTQQ